MTEAKLPFATAFFCIAALTLTAPVSAASGRATSHDPGLSQLQAAPGSQAMRVAQTERRPRRSRNQRNRESARGAGAFAGRYGILREKNRDVGCLLTLSNSGRAQLGPGCSDHGFVVFDPTRWQASGGKIILRARKGHRISFSRQADGTWRRDPAAKVPLGLKKY